MLGETAALAVNAASPDFMAVPFHPLVALAARSFGFIPLDDPGFALVLMSAVFGSLAVVALYVAGRSFGFSGMASAIGASAFGLSRTVWLYSVQPREHSLSLLIGVMLLCAVARVWSGRRKSSLALVVVMIVSVAHFHLLYAAIAPVALFAVIKKRELYARFTGIITSVVFVLFSVYAVFSAFPLTTTGDIVFDWSVIAGGFGGGASGTAFHSQVVLAHLASYIEVLPVQFFYIFLVLALLGFAFLMSERWKLAIALAWIWLAQSVGIAFMTRVDADALGFSTSGFFMAGTYPVIALLIAAGADGIITQAGGAKKGLAGRLAGLVMIAFLAGPLVANYSWNDLKTDSGYGEMRADMLRMLPRDAVVYLQGPLMTAPLIFEHEVKGLRGDVETVDMSGLLGSVTRGLDEREAGRPDSYLIEKTFFKYYGRRPQAFSFPQAMEGVDGPYFQRGPFFYYKDIEGCDTMDWDPGDYGFTPGTTLKRGAEVRMIYPFLQGLQAECAFANGDETTGVYFIREATPGMSNSVQSVMMLAGVLERSGRTEEAIAFYQKALELCETCSDAYLKAGGLFAMRGEREIADVYFKRALKANPNDVNAKIAQARLLISAGEHNSAIDIYRKLLDKDPRSIVVMNNLANILIETRSINEARQLFDRAFEMEPLAGITVVNYSSFLLQMGATDEAVNMLETYLEKRPYSALALYHYGLALSNLKDYNSAIEKYREAFRLMPDLEPAWSNCVMVQLETRDIQGARDTVSRMRESGELKLQPSASRLYLEVEKIAVQADPFDAQGWANLILGYIQLGKFEEARELIVEMREQTGGALEDLAVVLEEKLGAANPPPVMKIK